MACKLHRRIALRRKLQIRRTLTNSKSKSIINDASFYIYKLRLQVEAIRKEYQHLINHIQEVKVENLGTGGYLSVRVTCKTGEQVLASILEVLEEMNLDIVEANIACKHFFGMEAIVRADIDAAIVSQAILEVVRMQTQNARDG